MPTISATSQTADGRILISISWADIPTVLFARVLRTEADGTQVVVRPHTFTDSSGDYIELSGGLAVLYDTEAPMDENLTYTTEGLGSALTATTGTVVIASEGRPWLKSPIHPWQNKRLRLKDQLGDPDCQAGDEVYFASMADESRGAHTTVFTDRAREFPIPSTQTRGSIASSLRLISRTFEARDAVIQLNASGDVLLFQAPADYGIPDRYMAVDDYTVSRGLPDHKKPWRINTMPHVAVDEPAGLADGVLGVRWADVCDTYPTFDDAEAAGLTTTMVLMGYASSPPSNPAFTLYSNIPTTYTTYADIPAVGTYNDLLGGA